MDKTQLITLAKTGDSDAFTQLIKDSLVTVKPLIQKQYGLNQFDLDDVVQTSTVKAWNKVKYFRTECSFVTWFYTIIKNETLNFLKKRGLIERNEVHIPAGIEDANDEISCFSHLIIDDKLHQTALTILEKQESVKAYQAALKDTLDKLNPKHSEIIRLVLDEGMSYKEIASDLKMPLGSVMSRLYCARKQAQKLLNEYAKRNNIEFSCLGKY